MRAKPIVKLSTSFVSEHKSNNGLVFAILLLLTFTSYQLANYLQGWQLAYLILLIVLIKTGLVANNFMGLKDITRSWQLPMAIYLTTLVTLLAMAS